MRKPMTEPERRHLLETCRQTSILLEEFGQSLLPWALNDGKLPALLMKAVSRIGDMADKLPKDWIPMNGSQIATGSVLRDPDRIAAYLAAEGGGFSADAVQLLRSLQDHPAFFTALTVEEALGDDVFRMRDFSSGAALLISSPSLAELSRNPSPAYLTLLFSNGVCLQAIGPLHYFRGLEPGDFHYYASLVDADLYSRSGLSAVMTAAPESFVILDAFSETPPLSYRNTRLHSCTTTIVNAVIDPSALAGDFDIEEGKATTRLRLKGSEPPLAAADIYWDPGTREAFIFTRNLADYSRIARALEGMVHVPPEPQTVITPNMELIAGKLLGVKPAVVSWEAPFEPPPPSPEQHAELKRLNALLRELTDASNEGRSYDLGKLAARHRLSMDVARQAEQVIERHDQAMVIDIAGGLPGVPVPPPSERMKYREKLNRCPVFRFHTGEEAQHLFADLRARIESLRPVSRISRTRTLLTLPTLPDVLEEIDNWEGDPEHFVLKHTLYLLCHAGGESQGTDDYAAEILRLFWQALVGSKERAELRRFVRQYSIWCREVLVRTGIAEEQAGEGGRPPQPVKPGTPFRMRATLFLKTWAGLRKRP